MKKNLLTGVIAALSLSLGVVSCGDESSSLNSSTGTGHIKPLVQIDGSIITASGAPESRANEDVHVTVTDLKLKLTSADGSFSQEWESVNDFDESQEFKVGDYTLEAYYGDENDAEGFAKPHYHGNQTITVKYDNTTEVALSAEMKNSRVKVRYTDAFRDYMTEYKAHLVTSKNNFYTISGDETNPFYVTPGEVTLNLSFTKPDGNSTTIEVAKFEAKPKTEHVVTLDLAGGDAGADAILKVEFDDTVASQNIEINLSDDITNYPVPEIAPEGWTNREEFSHIEFAKAPAQIKANITAAGNIGSVMLYTTSPTLLAENWPEAIDLTQANSAQQALLTNLGLKARGVWNKPDKMAVVDFTDVFTHLGVGLGQEQSTHTFKLQVKDTHGQLSEEMEFSVIVTPLSIIIISADAVIGRTAVNAEVTYNGSQNLEEVIFQKSKDGGAYEDLIVNEITPVAGKEGTYKVTLTAPSAIERKRWIRACTHDQKQVDGIKEHSELLMSVTVPPFTISVDENDVFATHAWVKVDCEDADNSLVARNLKLSLNGKNWENRNRENADIDILKLTPDTEYTLIASYQDYGQTSTAVFHTEDAKDIENGGFATDTWHGAKLGDYQWLWSVDGWATNNELTTSTYGSGSGIFSYGGTAYRATSGTIPANGRSSKSHGGNSSEGHTSGDAEAHDTYQYGAGTNAALVRTVGWGSKNTALSEDIESCTCDERTEGVLSLGSYSKEDDNGGIEFGARPSKLSFYYHYDPAKPGNGDFGFAKIIVYGDNDNIISSDSIYLPESPSSAYIHKEITLNYSRGAEKAKKLSIIFKSTANPEALEKKNNFWKGPGTANYRGGEFVGSELYIDDVSLIY